MKSVRFTRVVQACGKPETHLVLVAPAKDRTLQAAVKAHRVMTVLQETVGNKADHGEIGFKPGGSRQFLVFPKSLRRFEGQAVVGIKYDEPESAPAKSMGAPKVRPLRKPKSELPRPFRTSPSKQNVIPFHTHHEEEDEDETVMELKKQVRRAMRALEEGKQVAAFNLLKRIVGG
jgi:hypothetical protein